MKHVIVAQGDAITLAKVRAPLAVGIARWQTHGTPAAVIVKATFSLAAGREVVVARFAEPDPVCKPLNSDLGEGIAAYPDDFVVHKPAADVIVHGHAHALEPREQIDVGLRIGSLERSLAVVANEPSTEIPLIRKYLREHAGQAPVPLHALQCQREMGEESADDFDFDRLQCAQDNMRVTRLALEEGLQLTGLSPRAEVRNVRIPDLRPAVWYDASPVELQPLWLVCDTLWVDTDFEKLVLVWRGLLPAAAPPDSIDRLLVALLPLGADAASPETREQCLRSFSRGTVSFAAEEDPSLLREPDPDDLEMARYELLEFPADPRLSVDQFAEVAATLAEQKRSREEVLEAHHLDERAWLVEERAWSEHVAEARSRDDDSVAQELAGKLVSAQDALRGPLEPRTLREYALLRVALDNTEKPGEMLLAQNIGIGEWARLERHWLTAAEGDRTLASELRQLLERANALLDENS